MINFAHISNLVPILPFLVKILLIPITYMVAIVPSGSIFFKEDISTRRPLFIFGTKSFDSKIDSLYRSPTFVKSNPFSGSYISAIPLALGPP